MKHFICEKLINKVSKTKQFKNNGLKIPYAQSAEFLYDPNTKIDQDKKYHRKMINDKTLYLPFQYCSMVIENSIIIVEDKKNNNIFDCIVFGPLETISMIHKFRVELTDNDDDDILNCILSKVRVYLVGQKCEYISEEKHSKLVQDDKDDAVGSAVQKMMQSCIFFILSLNMKNRFIIEHRSKVKKKKKIKKAPIYRALTPREYRRIVNVSNPNNPHFESESGSNQKIRASFERKGYWRTLRSDYYKNRQGERIWIDSTWVGKSEHSDPVDPNKIYKVRLDL